MNAEVAGAGSGGGASSTLFPPPESPAGRLLAYLVGLQIPGLPVETSLPALAGGAGLPLEAARQALNRLSAETIVLVEPEPDSDRLSITVMTAPAAADYGISPRWAAADEHALNVAAAGSRSAAQHAGATRQRRPDHGVELAPIAESERPDAGRAAAARPSRSRRSPPAALAAGPAVAPLLMALPEAEPALDKGSATRRRTTGVPAGSQARGRGGVGTSGSEAARRAEATGDETAVVRDFVERFERLLAERDDYRRRAQQAEQHAATVERLLREAVRRAETAEARLREAMERLHAWSELAQRMQALARQVGTKGGERMARSRGTSAAAAPEAPPPDRSQGELGAPAP